MSAELRARAREIINRRRRRCEFFPAAMFNEVAWEILLTLYASNDPFDTAALLSQGLQSPPSIGQRWIEFLVSQQLIEWIPNVAIDRKTAIALTNDGRRRIEKYLRETMQRT